AIYRASAQAPQGPSRVLCVSGGKGGGRPGRPPPYCPQARRLTLKETRRREEMPPRRSSPDLRARTKTTRRPWRGEAGKNLSRCSVRAAQPSAPVAPPPPETR